MKKILLIILGLALASPAWSSQTAVTQISGTQASVGALKTQVNTKLGTVESNRQDHETRVAAVEDGKADKTSFASQSAFTAAWGWTPGGISAWSDVQALITGSGDYIKYDGTRGTPPGATYTAGTDINISGGVISLSWDKDYADLINAPTALSAFSADATHRLVTDAEKSTWNAKQDAVSTTPLTASMITGVFPGTGDCLGSNGEKIACGSGGASAIADLTDWPSGLTATELGYANGVTGSIQSQIDALSAGGVPHVSSGYPSTAGAWNFNTTDYKLYTRLASGDVYSTSAMTLAAAADVTPTGFAFTDVMTDAALSTQYTACDQVAGIDWPATVTASGGTAAICTSATYATDCGTFGTSPGTVANNGWVCARHTSSASNSTATNTVVTVGTVTDTFSTTTIAGASLSALYDARVVFADGTQIGNSFKVCAYDASSSNALVECSSPGTVVNNSTQVATFAGTNSLISGHNYILGVVCNGGCAISKATGGSVVYDAAGSYASPPSSFTGTWTGSGTLSVEARNSSGTNLIGSIASPTQTQNLSGNYMYGADADAY